MNSEILTMQDSPNIESQIVFEDNHLLIINKNVGQLVQGDKTGDASLLDLIKDFIKKEWELRNHHKFVFAYPQETIVLKWTL